jgi:signal transduction histidine kinase
VDSGDDPVARALGWTSWIVAPLRAHGQTVGALTLASSDPARALGAGDLGLAASVGVLTGLAVSSQRVARERDELLTVVSHDLRNPLGVILLVVDLLRQGSPTPAVIGQIGRLERAAQTMSRILTDLVDAGRLGANTVPLETEVVEVLRIVGDACQAVQPVADQKGVTLEREPLARVALRADRARITRMVEQLVQSAVQRTPAGHRVSVAVETTGAGTVWTIADSAAKTAAGLEESPARRAGALGWLVARGVVQAHGGSLWIEPGGEGGTCTVVRFALPAAPPAR